jgi:DNA polymerase
MSKPSPTYVPGKGNPHATVVIVGEAPGREEDKKGEPFVGASGNLLDQLLDEIGLTREEIYITNVVKQRPPGNDFSTLYEDSSRSKPTKDLTEWRESLIDELREVRPNLVVTLGGEALKALGEGRKGIAKWRGSVFWNESLGCKVLSTFHPAYIFRSPADRPVLSADFRKIDRNTGPEMPDPGWDFLIEPSFDETMSELERIQKEKPLISFDLETLSNHIRCVGIASSPQRAICIPFVRVQSTPTVPGSGSFSFGSQRGDYWSADEEVLLVEKIREVMEDPSIPKVAQNFSFDATILAMRWGIHVKGLLLDTMHAHHVNWPELLMGLDFLTSLYTDHPHYSNHNAAVDREEWEYNCKDCVITLEIAPKIKADSESLGVWEFYKNHVEPTMYALTYMQNRGVLLDEEVRGELMAEYGEALTEVREKLESLGPETVKVFKKPAGYTYRGETYPTKGEATEAARAHAKAEGLKIKDEVSTIEALPPRREVTPFNPDSPDQMLRFLYSERGLPTQFDRKTKQPTVDEEALKKLRLKCEEKGKTEDVEILDTVLEYRKLSKRYQFSSIETDSDGRVRTSFNPSGTVNGRISSSKSIFGSGANLQQIPKRRDKSLRRIFRADPGCEMAKVDLSQAEVRLVAWEAPLPYLVRRFSDPEFDIHAWNASNIFDVSEADVTEDQRGFVKIGVHGGNYRLGAKGASAQFDVPYQQAKLSLEMYRDHLPLKEWWDRVEEEVRNTRMLRSPLGRVRCFLGRIDASLLRSAYSFSPQATVADIINRAAAWAMWTRLWDLGCEVLLQVHDELVFQYPMENRDEVLPIVKALMEPPIYTGNEEADPLVIPSEIEVGPNWKDVEEVEV